MTQTHDGDATRAAMLRFIAAFRDEYEDRTGPSIREIMDHAPLETVSAVHYQLGVLMSAGLVNWCTDARGRMIARSVWVTEAGREAVYGEGVRG